MTRIAFAVLGLAAMLCSVGAQAASNPPQLDFNSCAKPVYPPAAMEAKREGTVVLSFIVGADGSAIETWVSKSSGDPELDNTARDALKLCKFTPATKDDQPVQSSTKVQYVWVLK